MFSSSPVPGTHMDILSSDTCGAFSVKATGFVARIRRLELDVYLNISEDRVSNEIQLSRAGMGRVCDGRWSWMDGDGLDYLGVEWTWY